MRIVSLLASGTEIVCGLGAGEFLVGRSHECDNPAWVQSLPSCTRPAFDVHAASGAIDAEVRRRLNAREPLYHIDTDLINELKPDLLITQAHCEVCAVTPGDVARAGCVAAERVVALQVGTVAGIFDGIRSVGRALSREAAADDLVRAMGRRIASVANEVRDKPAPTVIALEWTDPAFVMGNWGPELVEAANGRLLLAEKGQHSRAVPWQAVRDAEAEYLIVAPCGFDLERTAKETPFLETLPGWFELRSVREGKVALADGNKYFNRSGTTIVETVEILAEILHGRAAGHQGKAWRWYAGNPKKADTRDLHAVACASGLPTYTDPATGSAVFTAKFLEENGPCCGNGCRHCPYG